MPTIDQLAFMDAHCLTADDMAKSGMTWPALEAIAECHRKAEPRLTATAEYITTRLRPVNEVHSMKLRVKNPLHLAAKVVRKRLERPDTEITPDNYESHITDLVGIRALHLFKGDWKPINDFVQATWNLHEKPTAYIREGDPVAVTNEFESSGCVVRSHPFGYRSVHYLLISEPSREQHIAELQVRTLFEEAWSEIDHRIRYPRSTNDPLLAEFLTIFNRLAGSADEMGTFIKALSIHLAHQRDQIAAAKESADTTQLDLENAIQQLKISSEEKAALKQQIDKLRESSRGGASFSLTGAGTYVPVGSLSGSSLLTSMNLSGGAINLQKKCVRCGKSYTDHSNPLLTVAMTICPECRNSGYSFVNVSPR